MKYLLTFQPLKPFFFGSQSTFSNDYFAVSEYFPQNTQLLGALRRYILEKKGLLRVYKNGQYVKEKHGQNLKNGDVTQARQLVGSAKSSDFESNSNLGKIKKLSPMFIVTKELDDSYFPTPFDIEIKEGKMRRYKTATIADSMVLRDYDVKNASRQHLGSNSFWNNYLEGKELEFSSIKSYSDIFKEHQQVGIGLEKKKTIDGKFYTKSDYLLDKGFLFATLFEFEESLESGVVQIGAENSLFKMQVHPLDALSCQENIIMQMFFDDSNFAKGKQMIAISDAIFENSIPENTDFAIVPFFKEHVMLLENNKKYFGGKTKPKRYVPQGSVYYMKEAQELPVAKGAYAKMGYNFFISTQES